MKGRKRRWRTERRIAGSKVHKKKDGGVEKKGIVASPCHYYENLITTK